jgi:hypothetical protein
MFSNKIKIISVINKIGLTLTILFIGWFFYNFAEVSLQRSRDKFQQVIEKDSSEKEIKEANEGIIRAINYNQMFIRYVGGITISFSVILFVLLIVNYFRINNLRKSLEQNQEQL